MREPTLCGGNGGDALPFSQLHDDDLKEVVAGRIKSTEECDTDNDGFDIAARYAAILLKERGL